MWVGNVPSNATNDELWEFFDQPLPLPSPTQTEPPKDRQQVCGGVSTVFVMSRSNCAFINFESEAQLQAATARFNGQPIRPQNPRCPLLVCRVRERIDVLMAGVGAQRGNGVHVKWVKEQQTTVRGGQTAVDPPKDTSRPSSPLSVSIDDVQAAGKSISRSPSVASTNSDFLIRFFPQRYFILKSLTQVKYPVPPRRDHCKSTRSWQYDLDLSVQKNVWATQPHNEEVLNQAYRTSKDVFLIFSVNKSGKFYGYARLALIIVSPSNTCLIGYRMAGPVEVGVPWAPSIASATHPSLVSSSSETRADAEGLQDQLSIFSPDHYRVKQSPRSAPAVQSSFPFGPREPYERETRSLPNPSSTCHSRTIDLPDALSPTHQRSPTRDTPESGEHDATPMPIPLEFSDAGQRLVPEEPFEGHDAPGGDEGTGSAWGRPFRIEWIRTNALTFLRTSHLRNPWNHGRQIKVSRDGTELEPIVGQQLLDEWDRTSASVAAADSSSDRLRTRERRRGSRSTQRSLVHIAH